jgi:hypothetical protein
VLAFPDMGAESIEALGEVAKAMRVT